MDWFQEIKDKQKSLQEEIRQAGEKEIKKVVKKVFEETPGLHCISWSQYTPSFNDGSPCYFTIGPINLLTKQEFEVATNEGVIFSELEFDDLEGCPKRLEEPTPNDFKNVLNSDAPDWQKENVALWNAATDLERITAKMFDKNRAQLDSFLYNNMKVLDICFGSLAGVVCLKDEIQIHDYEEPY